jgi:hypothetical protein
MGKYAIGVRVSDPDGDIGEIVGTPEKGKRTIKYEDGLLAGALLYWSKNSLTVVEPVEPSPEKCDVAFKVGDKVRVKADSADLVISHWNKNFGYRSQVDARTEFFVIGIEVLISTTTKGDGPYWCAKRFDLVSEPIATDGFKIGDRVLATGGYPTDLVGVIVAKYPHGPEWLCEFRGWYGGHDGREQADGHIEKDRWYVRPAVMALAKAA